MKASKIGIETKCQPKIAVNVFVIKDEEILLGKRKKGGGDGYWGLPGGHLEYMESLIDGAQRELMEETGLIARLTFENIVNEPLEEDQTHYLHINFRAHDIVGEPELKEPHKCYEWKWFSLGELPDNLFLGHRNVIKTFKEKQVFIDKRL